MSTALLIIDVQHALCTGDYACDGIEAVIGRLNGVIAAAREQGVPVVFIQHEEEEDLLRHGSEGWQLDARLDVRSDDRRVRKTAPDSFHRTELGEVLQSLGARQLVIGGLQTDFCVDTTVRRALSSGFDVTLIEDGHTTMDDGGLSAAQIVAHHNRILGHLNSFGPSMGLRKAADVRFG